MKELPKEILDQIETDTINVSWYTISHKYNLNEEFISKYKDKLNWIYISECQKLSEEFIYKHKEYMHLYMFIRRDDLKDCSKEMQEYIFLELVEDLYETEYYCFTPYMKELYQKYKIMI